MCYSYIKPRCWHESWLSLECLTRNPNSDTSCARLTKFRESGSRGGLPEPTNYPWWPIGRSWDLVRQVIQVISTLIGVISNYKYIVTWITKSHDPLSRLDPGPRPRAPKTWDFSTLAPHTPGTVTLSSSQHLFLYKGDTVIPWIMAGIWIGLKSRPLLADRAVSG